jgi:hypothetical protein
MFACASVLGDVASIFGEQNAGRKFLTEVLPYTLLMGVAGAAAGGIGGYVGSVSKRNEQNAGGTPTGTEEPAEQGPARDRGRHPGAARDNGVAGGPGT